MQNYFKKQRKEKTETSNMRLDLDQRSYNWHQNTLAVRIDGALHLSKDALKRIESGDTTGNAF